MGQNRQYIVERGTYKDNKGGEFCGRTSFLTHFSHSAHVFYSVTCDADNGQKRNW